jgi:disulfide oxidoreductase YuzD
MIQIKVFGTTPPCAKCKRAEREAKKAAAQFPNQVDVVKLNVMSDEAQQYGLVMTPLVVVDDEVVGSGRVAPAAKLVSVIEAHLEA